MQLCNKNVKCAYQHGKNATGIEFIVFDKEAGFRGFDDVWKKLSGRKFDALVHMQLSFRSSVLTLGIRAKYKVGFNFRRAKEGQWLFTNRKIPDCESAHVMDSFLSFTEYLGVPRQDPKWDLSLSASDEQFAQSIINNASTVVISPAASKDERNWVTERYAEFADLDRKSTRLNSSHANISYAVLCLATTTVEHLHVAIPDVCLNVLPSPVKAVDPN